MTYDNGAGDGPYKWVKQSMWDYPTISGPGIEGNKKNIGAKEWLEMVNLAHAEGVKAERERCLNVLKKYPDDGKELGDILEMIRLEIKELI